MAASSGKRKKVCYFYDQDVPNYYYGPNHPMKPFRLRLTHELIVGYGLYRKMNVFRPRALDYEDVTAFHDQDYVDFLKNITPDTYRDKLSKCSQFALGDTTDCPIFDGLFEFGKRCSAGSVDGAIKLNHGDSNICINWSGGLHHAKKSEASGFCYINDIVLAILELLKFHDRVLYIDIDVHHGDGVEEAFWTSDRVVTVSFHRYGDFFPGSGDLTHIGVHNGRYHTINVPLEAGIDDENYERLFKQIIQSVMDRYRPGAVVLQCGADSLAHDRLGCFNLSLKGHGMCVDFLKSFNVPLLLLGGGGYNIRNVARCWCYETAVALDTPLDNDIPYNNFLPYYGPKFLLHITPDARVRNENKQKEMKDLVHRVLQNIERIRIAPSVQMFERPHDSYKEMKDAEAVEKEQITMDVSESVEKQEENKENNLETGI